MTTVPAPSLAADREEWLDADFDLPEGQLLNAGKDDEEEDWDLEMDLGKTGGASVACRPQLFTIRPPQAIDDEDDDDGVSTIKVAALPKPIPAPIEDDFEDGFALPSDLTQLSLAPLSLNHRSSKNSLEWGDKDHTSSSQSSDAYSTLGFANASPSSNSTSSVSLPDTETDDDDDEDHMDGLVIPSGLFESKDAGSKLTQILELRQKAVEFVSPNAEEEDFEMGLVIDDDVDFSPSRLLYSAQQMRHANRSQSMPNPRPKALRLTSTRVKSIDRAKSPVNPPVSSSRQFQKLRLSPSPPLNRPPSRSQNIQTLISVPSPSPSSSSFLSPKPGSLRGQKSHSGLKPPTPPASTRKLTRKASLSSLLENNSQASGPGSAIAGPSKARYEEPTAASRAKSQKSTSRLRGLDYSVPPTRPSTPSTNPNAVRLTLPTAVRIKSRPALSSVFNNTAPPSPNPGSQSPSFRTASPLPPRPPSNLSNRASRITFQPSAPKVMKKPKRQRTYGDGTELDGFDDLPTDRDKESRFRVQPKGYGNRIPGGTFSSKSSDKSTDKNTIRKKKRDVSGGSESSTVLAPTVNSMRRSSRMDLMSPSPTFKPLSPKKKKKVSSPSNPRKKPTLIRNLGGVGAPKVVGDMHWNPQTLRWEGNEQVLREFDSVVTSTRPALITHLTGSSIGSPVGSFATGARKVGNMMFDPQRMCWISTLPPEEEEPDVFANLADDEDDDAKGDTIRVNLQSAMNTPDTSVHSRTSTSMSSTAGDASSSRNSYAPSESGSERGSRASMVYDIDEDFIEKCKAAEQRHIIEIKGWRDILVKQNVQYETERPNLYEIRDLATRKY